MTHASSVIPLPPELGASPREELAYRLQQQAALSEFGAFALRCYDLDALFQRAVVLCAQGMAAELCKILQYEPAGNRLRVRAGIGWAAGVVGTATVGADVESPAGFALKTGRPVISNHLGGERRFRTPKLLADHGVKRAVNVLIAAGSRALPFGVLEVDSPHEGRFEKADLDFMQGFASLLGVAIERQGKDAALRESEEESRLIIEGAQDYAILTTDVEGRVDRWLPGAEATFGFSAEEIEGKPIALLFTPEDRGHDVPAQELEKARRDGVAPDDRWHVCKNGERVWIQGATRPLHDAEGKLRGFLKIGRDETLRRSEREALLVSEERTRMAIESAAIGTWDFNPATDELRWDSRCKALFGVPAGAEVTYRTFLERTHPDDLPRVEGEIARALDPAGTGEFDTEYRVLGQDAGSDRWVMAKGKCFIENGTAMRFVGTVVDITSRKQAEEHTRILQREVSHRVKNSLSMVASLLRLQARDSALPEVNRALGDAHARITTIAEVHDHLWQQQDAEQVELGTFLRELCDSLQQTAPNHRLDLAAEPVTIATDRAIPIALLVNELVTNAFKYAYAPGSGGAVSVRLHLSPASRIVLEVADRGAGLPEGFDPKRPGASLGMRLVTALTRQLGAKAEFRNAEPGALVTIDIPA